jgi:phospholipase/lecithinase/hemolysin
MNRIVTSIAVAACVLGAATPAAAQQRFSGLVFFGTSLSDSGNAFALLGSANTPHDYDLNAFLVPSRPYARGGHHFSDGATWAEQFARSMGLAGNARPALANAGKAAANYAVGGARSVNAPLTFDLPDQVGAFLSDRGGVARADALYVIEMGGNDLRDALTVAATEGQPAAELVIGAAVQSIGHHIGLLYQAGARKFLVWNAPNLGLTPAIQTLGPQAAFFADQFSQGFNGGLAQLLSFLEGPQGLPGIQFYRLDVYGKLNAIVEDPEAYGLTNVKQACITPQSAPSHCSDFKDYLFWDGIHPTTAAQAIIAQHAATALAP